MRAIFFIMGFVCLVSPVAAESRKCCIVKCFDHVSSCAHRDTDDNSECCAKAMVQCVAQGGFPWNFSIESYDCQPFPKEQTKEEGAQSPGDF